MNMKHIHVGAGTLKDFAGFLQAFQGGSREIGRVIAESIGVPFREDCKERLLGYRYAERAEKFIEVTKEMKAELLPKRRFLVDGDVVESDDQPPNSEWLTEGVWSRDHWPDSFNGIREAVDKVEGGVAEIYYHYASMNLVLVDATGQKIGIRSVDIMQFETELISELFKLECSTGDGHDA